MRGLTSASLAIFKTEVPVMRIPPIAVIASGLGLTAVWVAFLSFEMLKLIF
jgi:hypothetical protein